MSKVKLKNQSNKNSSPLAARKGVFIVLEGTDGSGKTTQFKLLEDKLRKEGYAVETFDFPQYENDSSHFIKKYLNGEYGSLDNIDAYTASMFYALDRYEASSKINEALKQGKIVLSNRFTGANMAHQGTKFSNAAERRGYFIWVDSLEFQMLKIPRPDLSIVLRVPAEIAQKQVDSKEKREYTDKKRDLHEEDLNHLKKSVYIYDSLCELFPRDFKALDCVRTDNILPPEKIHNLVYKTIKPMLPAKNLRKSDKNTTGKDVSDPNPYLSKINGHFQITNQGKHYLKDAITNTDGDVYAFTDKLSPVTIAAAMARLSRRGDDMRVTILDEFAGKADKDEQLLHRVITAYGDDSVQQLVGQHLVVENASNLLTKKLEWGRLASYLEQSTRYIYFDQKDSKNKYKYYTPGHLDKKSKQMYEKMMDEIFDIYSDLVHKLSDYVRINSNTPKNEQDAAWKGATRAQACDAARAVLPVATKSTVGIYASGQALESLIMDLMSDELREAKQTGQKILKESRKVASIFLERADKPDRGGATMAYFSKTKENITNASNKHLNGSISADLTNPVKLIDFWPKNELELTSDILFENSSLSIDEIRQKTEHISYEDKAKLINTYCGERLNRRHKPGRSIEKLHYNFEIICDYGIFRDLQRHRMVDDLQWQQLTPRYGYETPRLIEDAGLTDLFDKCFNISLKLHSYMQDQGYVLDSQYATLLGHKMRWKLTINAREAFHLIELRTSPQGHPGYRKIAKLMYDRIKSVHPLIASNMRFVNQGEDPALTRLAAERYTQFKLNNLQ